MSATKKTKIQADYKMQALKGNIQIVVLCVFAYGIYCYYRTITLANNIEILNKHVSSYDDNIGDIQKVANEYAQKAYICIGLAVIAIIVLSKIKRLNGYSLDSFLLHKAGNIKKIYRHQITVFHLAKKTIYHIIYLKLDNGDIRYIESTDKLYIETQFDFFRKNYPSVIDENVSETTRPHARFPSTIVFRRR